MQELKAKGLDAGQKNCLILYVAIICIIFPHCSEDLCMCTLEEEVAK